METRNSVSNPVSMTGFQFCRTCPFKRYVVERNWWVIPDQWDFIDNQDIVYKRPMTLYTFRNRRVPVYTRLREEIDVVPFTGGTLTINRQRRRADNTPEFLS